MERDIIAYDIVTGENARDLAQRIATSMQRGWVPQGGIATNNDGYPMQAVVKYKSPNQN